MTGTILYPSVFLLFFITFWWYYSLFNIVLWVILEFGTKYDVIVSVYVLSNGTSKNEFLQISYFSGYDLNVSGCLGYEN